MSAGDINLAKHKSSHYVSDVNEICRPLFRELGINYFDYAKFYHDGTYLLLYTDFDWVNFFLNDKQYIKPVSIINSGLNLWQSYIDNELLSIGRQQFNHDHGVTLHHDYRHYKEVFNFSAPSENTHAMYLYLNKTQLFENFSKYFLKKTESIRAELEKNKLINNRAIAVNHQQICKSVIDERASRVERFISSHMLSKRLTPREAQCLELVLKGMSSKEIGLQLDISYRTAERHIENIKIKYGCKNRASLIAMLYEIAV